VTAPTPFAAHDLIFVTNGYRGIQPIYASGPSARYQSQGSNSVNPLPEHQAVVLHADSGCHGEHLYVEQQRCAMFTTRGQANGVQQRLGDKGGAYSASVVAADGKVYFTSEDGDVFVIKAGNQYELLASNTMGEVLMATPTISDGMI
jgi:outer membrane protein assembly factor BamB